MFIQRSTSVAFCGSQQIIWQTWVVGSQWASSWEKRLFAYAKTKTQISFAVTVKMITAFVFPTRIVKSLYFLNPKFHACRHLLWLYSLVCVGHGRKPRRPVFSQRGSNRGTSLRLFFWDFCLFCLCWSRLNIPVNNFSVMSGQSHHFLGITVLLGG